MKYKPFTNLLGFIIAGMFVLAGLAIQPVEANTDGHMIIKMFADKAVKEFKQPEKKPEPFKLNGLYIGQDHGKDRSTGAGSIIMNMLTRSNVEHHPAYSAMVMTMIVNDFNWLYGYKGKYFTYKGFNMVLCEADDKVVAIFLGGYDADLDRPELIPKPPEGKAVAPLEQIAKRFKDLQDIKTEPKYGYLPNQGSKAAYWILDDCAVFVFDNLTIQMFKKTDKLLKSISPVPVNKNRPIKKPKPKFKQVDI
jgi:hypothetical protein